MASKRQAKKIAHGRTNNASRRCRLHNATQGHGIARCIHHKECAVVARRALAGWIALTVLIFVASSNPYPWSQVLCSKSLLRMLLRTTIQLVCKLLHMLCRIPTGVLFLGNCHNYPRQVYKKDWLLCHQLARLWSQCLTGHVTVTNPCVAALLLIPQEQLQRNAKPTHQQTTCPSTPGSVFCLASMGITAVYLRT
jgi:hypothetical protein